MDEDVFYEGEPQAEPEVQEPQAAAAPAGLDEAEIQRRYVQPLEDKVSRLEATLDPERIGSWQKQQDFQRQRTEIAARFHKSLEDGDALQALRVLVPQLGMWDNAYLNLSQAHSEQQQKWAEQEQLRQITAEVEEDELYFYAHDPEGHALLREFPVLAARQYAEARGPGSKVTREDTKAAKEWMAHLFGEKDFFSAASEMAGYVRAYKAAVQAAQPAHRRIPTAPAPGARTGRAPANPEDDLMNDFYS